MVDQCLGLGTSKVERLRVVVLQSFCKDDEDPTCTDEFPCPRCLSEGRVIEVTGEITTIGSLNVMRHFNGRG